jgi:biopolymer transport protein ExbB
MRTFILVASILIAPLLLSAAAAGSSTASLDTPVTSRIGTIEQNHQETLALIASERAELAARREKLQREIRAQKQRNAKLRSEFEALLQQETNRREELHKQHREWEALRETIRSAARDALDLFTALPSTPEFPDRMAVVDRILAPEHFPEFPDTSALLDSLEQAMRHSGTIESRQGSFIGRDGREHNGTVVRVGEFAAFYDDPKGDFGFLRPDGSGSHLEAVSGRPGWLTRRTIKSFLRGEGDSVPMDISGGTVLEELEQRKSLWETVRSGGVLIWPILVSGLAGILIGLERIFRLRGRPGSGDNLLPDLLSLVGRERFADAADLCRASSQTPLGRVLGNLMAHAGAGREILESCLEENLLREAAPLERLLPTLSVLAATAPLLGLLGTVTGMISTFQAITVFGSGDPRMMSGGISEALITTQLGLAVAIPLVLLHHFLDRKVDTIIGEMEEQGTTLTLALLKHSTDTGSR